MKTHGARPTRKNAKGKIPHHYRVPGGWGDLGASRPLDRVCVRVKTGVGGRNINSEGRERVGGQTKPVTTRDRRTRLCVA